MSPKMKKAINMPKTKQKNIQEGWHKVKLGDLFSVRRGASPRPINSFLSDKGLPWVKIADATADNSRFISKTNQFIKEEGVKNTVVVNSGDFILSNSATPGLPKFMKIQAGIHDGWLLLSDFNNTDKNFIYYLLLGERSRLVGQSTGAVFNNLKTDIVRKFPVMVPENLNEQKRISSILSAFDEKIELNDKINQTLEDMAQAIFKEWFSVDMDDLPDGWEVKTIDEITDFTKGKKPKEITEYKNDGQKEYLLIESFTGSKKYYTSDKKLPFVKEYDPLIVMDGASSGKVFVGREGCIGSTLGTLKLKPGYQYLSNIFILQLLQYIEKELKGHLTGSAIPHVDKNYLFKRIVVVPSEKDAKKYSEKTFSIIEEINKNQKENQTLAAMRDALLPKLMKGEIRV